MATSTGPGSGRRRTRATARRTASHSAPTTWPPSSGSSGSRLNTNRARFSAASRLTQNASFVRRVIGSAVVPCSAPTSPANRPMPTMLTRLSGSRSSSPLITLTIPVIFSGILTTTPAICPTLSASMPGTTERDWGCRSSAGTTPRNPTFSVNGRPSSERSISPDSSCLGRSAMIGVIRRLRVLSPLRTTTGISRSPLSRIAARTVSQDPASTPPMESTTSPGRRPAAAPGARRSVGEQGRSGASTGSTHSWTTDSRVLGSGSPKPVTTMPMNSAPSSRFIVGPPSMMISRWWTGRW